MKSTAEENRDRFASAALALILEAGTQNLNLTGLCARAQMSRATFYRHFPGMDNVIESVVHLVIKQFSRDIATAIKARPLIEDRIDAICDVLGSSASLEVAQKLLRSDVNFMIDLGRRARSRTLAIFHDAMLPVYELAEQMLGGSINPRLITDVIGRIHISFSVYPEPESEMLPAELLKYVFRSLLVRPAPARH